MPQSYTPEFKKRLFFSMRKKGAPTKVAPQSTVYPRPAFPNGAANSAKNARTKPGQSPDKSGSSK